MRQLWINKVFYLSIYLKLGTVKGKTRIALHFAFCIQGKVLSTKSLPFFWQIHLEI